MIDHLINPTNYLYFEMICTLYFDFKKTCFHFITINFIYFNNHSVNYFNEYIESLDFNYFDNYFINFYYFIFDNFIYYFINYLSFIIDYFIHYNYFINYNYFNNHFIN